MRFFNRNKLSVVIVLILVFSILSGCNQEQNLNNETNISENEAVQSVFTNIQSSLVDTEDAMNIIKELSSPKYKGRLTGTEESILAVQYIAGIFNEIGLKIPQGLDDYNQMYTQKTIITEDKPLLNIISLSGDVERKFDYIKDFRVRSLWENTRIKGNVKGQTYFVGDTTELTKENKELENKILLIGEEVLSKYGANGIVQSVLYLDAKINAVIINMDERREGNYIVSRSIIHEGTYDDEGPIILYCTDSVYEELLGASKEGKEIEISVNFAFKDVDSANVVGVIPGSDESLKNEYIIIGAHLDHVGDNKDGTYNPGALDNASGIEGLAEIAESIMESNNPPKKTIIFIAFNGEEESMKGSSYYTKNPIYPLENSVMINLDMIGSKEEIPLDIAIASSKAKDLKSEFKEYADKLEIEAKSIVLDRSDHRSFDEEGVESVLLIHLDESRIHTITDTIENTVSEDRLREVIELVLYYIDNNAY